jgi:Mg2+-importing ATPase
MSFFGPISSLYDFGTFAVMLLVFHAHASLFRSGWFVESLATQSLVVFVIRTHRVPFFSSRPSRPLLVSTLAVVVVGVVLPYSPLAHVLGFRQLPVAFLAILVGMTATYLVLVELGKRFFFRRDELRVSRNDGTEARGCGGGSPPGDSRPWRRSRSIRAGSTTS